MCKGGGARIKGNARGDGCVPVSQCVGLRGPPELASLLLKNEVDAVLPAVGEAAQEQLRARLAHAEGVAEVLERKLLSRNAELHEAVRGALKLHRVTGLVLEFLPETQLLVQAPRGGTVHAATGSANVDLFFHSIRQALHGPDEGLRRLLAAAWQEDASTCLKLIFQLGARAGKQDRYGFYEACLWLYKEQPATLLANLHLVPRFGCWKGLCELVARACEGNRAYDRDRAIVFKFALKDPQVTADDGVSPWLQGDRLQQAARALRRYHEDPLYRALHNCVAELFASQLRRDLESMRLGKAASLCAKWCPALGNSFDRRTLLCEAIARQLFPKSLPEYAEAPEEHYAYQVRDRLRREVLTPLKAYRREPEVLVAAGRWQELDYKHLPAGFLRTYAEAFKKHDPDRFQQYLQDLKAARAGVAVGQLQPHQLLRDMEKGGDAGAIASAQWEKIVAGMPPAAARAVACCDVSYSMEVEAAPGVTCMEVAVSLTLLLADAPGPYKGKVLSFAQHPQVVTLPSTSSLPDRARAVKAAPCQQATNLSALFDLLLAQECPERVFIFSDMDFGLAVGLDGGLETDLAAARKKFAAAGRRMPEVVFWNIAGGGGAPALATAPGCALVSGYSKALVKQVLQSDSLNALKVVEGAVARRPYRALRVVSADEEARSLVQAYVGQGPKVKTAAAVTSAGIGAPAPAPTPCSAGCSIDLCFVMDCTGSMGAEIEAARESLLQLVEVVKKQAALQTGEVPTLRLACVAYRDYCDGFERLQGISFRSGEEGHQAVRDFMKKQAASGGGDMPEDVFGGMDGGLRLDWRSQLRFMVLVADAAGHGKLYGDEHEDHPNGDPAGHTHLELMRRMATQRISLLFLTIGRGVDRMRKYFDRCSPTGPIGHMMMDRGCTDYSLAFKERISSVIIRRLSQELSGRGAGKAGGGMPVTGGRRCLREISLDVARGLSETEAGNFIGPQGCRAAACRRALRAVLRDVAGKLHPQRPWEWADGERAPGRQTGEQRAGRKYPRRPVRAAQPMLWLDVCGHAENFSVVLTVRSRMRPEALQEVCGHLLARARPLLSLLKSTAPGTALPARQLDLSILPAAACCGKREFPEKWARRSFQFRRRAGSFKTGMAAPSELASVKDFRSPDRDRARARGARKSFLEQRCMRIARGSRCAMAHTRAALCDEEEEEERDAPLQPGDKVLAHFRAMGGSKSGRPARATVAAVHSKQVDVAFARTLGSSSRSQRVPRDWVL